MPITALNKDTAPRDLEQLVKAGVVNLHRLAKELGIFDDADNEAGFKQLPIPKKAEAILTFLQQYDADGGTSIPAAAPSEPKVEVARREPVNNQQKVQVKVPGAVQPPGPKAAGMDVVLKQMETIHGSLQDVLESVYGGEGKEGMLPAMKGVIRLLNLSITLQLILAEHMLGEGAKDQLLEEALRSSTKLTDSNLETQLKALEGKE